jgi:hypothetical protein
MAWMPGKWLINKRGDKNRHRSFTVDLLGAPTVETSTYSVSDGRSFPPALNDSLIVLAVWIVEKFWEWSDCGGDIERRFSEDELLTHVMIYWLTRRFARRSNLTATI